MKRIVDVGFLLIVCLMKSLYGHNGNGVLVMMEMMAMLAMMVAAHFFLHVSTQVILVIANTVAALTNESLLPFMACLFCSTNF